MTKKNELHKTINKPNHMLSLLVLGQGKGRLAVESLFGSRIREDLSFFYNLTFNPKEADVLIVTGPIGPRMEPLIKSTYEQMLSPKKLIVAGTEALNGGIFDEMTLGKKRPIWSDLIPDAVIYGEPPSPQELCYSFVKLYEKNLKKVPSKKGKKK